MFAKSFKINKKKFKVLKNKENDINHSLMISWTQNKSICSIITTFYFFEKNQSPTPPPLQIFQKFWKFSKNFKVLKNKENDINQSLMISRTQNKSTCSIITSFNFKLMIWRKLKSKLYFSMITLIKIFFMFTMIKK